ncbi:MAG: hypothetical protein AAFX00_09425, partial [Pseudomonadota bacterium]
MLLETFEQRMKAGFILFVAFILLQVPYAVAGPLCVLGIISLFAANLTCNLLRKRSHGETFGRSETQRAAMDNTGEFAAVPSFAYRAAATWMWAAACYLVLLNAVEMVRETIERVVCAMVQWPLIGALLVERC